MKEIWREGREKRERGEFTRYGERGEGEDRERESSGDMEIESRDK